MIYATAPDPLPAPAEVKLAYERGGGFAPSTSTLAIRPGLKAVAATTGGRAGRQRVTFRIAANRVLAIERGLSGAHFGRLESASDTGCADCYFYSLAYRGHRVNFDQSQVPPGLESVIAEIEAIISAHAIPPNARATHR